MLKMNRRGFLRMLVLGVAGLATGARGAAKAEPRQTPVVLDGLEIPGEVKIEPVLSSQWMAEVPPLDYVITYYVGDGNWTEIEPSSWQSAYYSTGVNL